MKTSNGRTTLGLMAMAVICGSVQAQWNTGGGSGHQYLTAPTQGVRVGTSTATPPSALTVNGDEMTAPTGEVFRTIGPVNSNSTWRLYSGGTGAANERGRLFSLSADDYFHLDALNGDMRFCTNNLVRALDTQIIG